MHGIQLWFLNNNKKLITISYFWFGTFLNFNLLIKSLTQTSTYTCQDFTYSIYTLHKLHSLYSIIWRLSEYTCQFSIYCVQNSDISCYMKSISVGIKVSQIGFVVSGLCLNFLYAQNWWFKKILLHKEDCWWTI